ncbi:hypothetical protein SSP24_74700 [Streptomyces spinoverrucosus]|uniref:Lipoprotein n=2 Tax=Streptomyces spinoverrucosus TaxID=284043 RepID=A0A4Y3VUQ0_9ACTN|nr:hypothetical protein [Streptomyces spinoverrucosus]GEC09815.1 hypothetical protein SSP24_74700 [Streptomyces spinoverrucosus]GHB96943.1 hypothetical protein GCM10010397_81890 [Streptomyces spinoverrucosus]
MTSKPLFLRIAMAGVSTALLLVGVAGCGATGGAFAGKQQETPSASQQQAPLKYAQCMRDNGVPMEDPTGDGSSGSIPADVPKSAVDKADKACKKYAPEGGADNSRSVGSAPPDGPRAQKDRLEFAQCMRDHGYDMPDPGSDGSVSLDMGDAAFRKASAACRDILMKSRGQSGEER